MPNAVATNDSIAVSKQSKTAFISAEGVVASDSVEVGAKNHRKTPENEEHIARNDSNTVLKQPKATFITAEDDVASNLIVVRAKEQRQMSGNEENTAKNAFIAVSKQSKTMFLATENIVPSSSSAIKAKKHRKTTGKEGKVAKNNSIAVSATKQPRKLPIGAGNIATNVSDSAATKKQKIMPNMAQNISLLTTNSSAQSTQNQPNAFDTVAASSPIPADRNKQVKTPDIHENAAANNLKSLAVNSKDATVISPRNNISVSEKENYRSPNKNRVTLPNNRVTLPNNCVTLPNNCVTLPNSRVTLPNNPVTLPNNNRVTLPNNCVTLPNKCVTLPNSRLTLPNNPVTLPNNCVTLPNSRMTTPKNVNVNSGSNAVPKKKLRTIIPQSNSVVVQDPGLECPSNKQSADLVRNSLVVDSQELQVNSDVAANDSCSVPQWQIVLNPQFVTQKRAATHDMPSEGDDDLQIASSCDIASNLQVIQNPAASVAINLGPINEVVNQVCN